MRFGVFCALVLWFVAATSAPSAAAGFVLSSPAFSDGGTLSADYAGLGDCGGKNVSPPLAWSGAPSGTKSYAIIVTDMDGRNGMGVVHWVAYGIAPDTTSIPVGFGSTVSPAYRGGPNNRKLPTFLGLCPSRGDPPHHYAFFAYALDLAPDALAPGLSREELLAAMQGHALAASVLIGTFARK
jgi:Raf kinase inhibitor-like YbhB/YbcL family protein